MTVTPSLERARRLLALSTVVLLVASCGGGSGSGITGETGSGAPAAPSPSPSPGPSPSPSPSPSPGPTTSPIGRLWHDNFALDSVRGLQLSPLNGDRSVRLDPVETAVPTPDGLHFVVYEYDISTRVSTVTLRATDSLALVSRATFNGYVHRIKPSPARLGEMLVVWAECAGCTTAGQGDLTFVDLPGRRVLERFSEVDAAADWLPDGRYVHVDAAGQVHVGTAGGTRNQTGTLAVASRKLKELRVDPAGQQMITRWVRESSAAATDLWISSIDGRNLQQLTATGLTTYGFWSPDGALFGFDLDTDSGCNTTGCSAVPTGRCDLFFAPSGDRNLTLAGNQARQFTVVDQVGRSETLGCNLRGWTR